MGYLGSAPSRNTPAYKQVYEFVATAAQTTFSVAYTVGFVEVYRNGVKLGAPNFTANNGTSVVLTSGANAGDFIQIVSEFINPVLNAIPNTTGAVTTNNIADNAITTAKIADNAITTSKIAAGAVVQADLASGVAGTGNAFSAQLSSDQTIASNSTWTKLTFNSEDFDTSGCYDNSTNYRFTPTVAGYYQVNYMGVFNSLVQQNNAGSLAIYKNGSSYRPMAAVNSGVVGQNFEISYHWNCSMSLIIYMNGSTDYLEIYAWHTYGNNGMSVLSGATFSSCLVRAA